MVLSLVKMSGKTVLAPLNMEFGEMKCHTRVLQLSTNKKSKMSNMNFLQKFFLPRYILEGLRDHPFKTSACLRGGGVSPCADGQKVTVHKDQKSPS